jgi:hypothetical protein
MRFLMPRLRASRSKMMTGHFPRQGDQRKAEK